MRSPARTAIVAAGALAVLAAGGGLTAWAGWTTTGVPAQVTARAGHMPGMSAPTVKLAGGDPVISWDRVAMPTGQSVGGYVVTRTAGDRDTVVCQVGAAISDCRDAKAPTGDTVTYVVHATEQNWSGKDSPRSAAVSIPAAATATTTDNLAAQKPTAEPQDDIEPAVATAKPEEPAPAPAESSPPAVAEPDPADATTPPSDSAPAESSSPAAPPQ
jgi:hypothetical protein